MCCACAFTVQVEFNLCDGRFDCGSMVTGHTRIVPFSIRPYIYRTNLASGTL